MFISPGWTVESVQSVERRFATVVHRAAESEHELDIEIVPPLEGQSIALEFRSRNASLSLSEASNPSLLMFDGERPINFLEVNQSDIYWVEPVGRYKLEATTELLQCQIDEQQLSEQHLDRLPRIVDIWLIKPDGSRIPNLIFRRQPAPYNVQAESYFQPSLNGVIHRYQLRCTPLAGTVSSVLVDLGQFSVPEQIQWRYRPLSNSGEESDWEMVQARVIHRDPKKNSKKPPPCYPERVCCRSS